MCKDEFFLGKSLRHWELSPSLVFLHPPISSTSVGGMIQFVSQIHSMGVILVGYWVAVQVSTMRSSVMYNGKFRMGDINLSRVTMITCYTLLRSYLRSASIVSMIGSYRGGFYGLGGVTLQLF